MKGIAGGRLLLYHCSVYNLFVCAVCVFLFVVLGGRLLLDHRLHALHGVLLLARAVERQGLQAAPKMKVG